MKIIINDKERAWAAPVISYSQVVALGLSNLPCRQREGAVVTYRRDGNDMELGLTPRSSTPLQEGMVFTVTERKNDSPWRPEPTGRPGEMTYVKDIQPAAERETLKAGRDGWPANWPQEKKDAEIKRTRELLRPYEEKYQAEQAAKASSEIKAQLKDAFVIITLLYEEMVTAGMRTPGRAMAGRLLYSAGYAETVKALDGRA